MVKVVKKIMDDNVWIKRGIILFFAIVTAIILGAGSFTFHSAVSAKDKATKNEVKLEAHDQDLGDIKEELKAQNVKIDNMVHVQGDMNRELGVVTEMLEFLYDREKERKEGD